MTTTTFKILLNVNFTIMKHFWVVLIVDKATEKANLPQNLSSPFSFPFYSSRFGKLNLDCGAQS